MVYWFQQVPVLVSDLDIECRLWVKIRLAPLSPYLGTISLAFVAPPNIKVQLSPYNSVRLMRVPVLQVGIEVMNCHTLTQIVVCAHSLFVMALDMFFNCHLVWFFIQKN